MKSWLYSFLILFVLLFSWPGSDAAGLQLAEELPLSETVLENPKITQRIYELPFESSLMPPFLQKDRFLVLSSENYSGPLSKATTIIHDMRTNQSESIDIVAFNTVFRDNFLYFTRDYGPAFLTTELVQRDLLTGEETVIHRLSEGGFAHQIALRDHYLAWRELNPAKDTGESVVWSDLRLPVMKARQVVYDLDKHEVIYSRDDLYIGDVAMDMRIHSDHTIFEVSRREDGSFVGELRDFLSNKVLVSVPVAIFVRSDYANGMLAFHNMTRITLTVINVDDGKEIFSVTDDREYPNSRQIRDFAILKGQYLVYSTYDNLRIVDLKTGETLFDSREDNERFIEDEELNRFSRGSTILVNAEGNQMAFTMRDWMTIMRYSVIWTFE